MDAVLDAITSSLKGGTEVRLVGFGNGIQRKPASPVHLVFRRCSHNRVLPSEGKGHRFVWAADR